MANDAAGAPGTGAATAAAADPADDGSPHEERIHDEGPTARHTAPTPIAEQRTADLGPEARGLPTEERLAVAGERLKATQQTIRIDVSRLDELMNLVGELVVHKTRLAREAHEVTIRLGDDPLARQVDEGNQHFARIASQLQDQVTRLRMLPIETVFNRFPRVVRDLASRFGKDVELVIEGKETELDRSVLEEVGDPLTHLVRNALDHGVEPVEGRIAAGKRQKGRVTLGARHGDGQIIITVADDGAGIDPAKMKAAAVRKGLMTEAAAAGLSDVEALDLIFAPGFSTATMVTDVSGRGVGMDVVRTNIARLGGRVEVRSTVGSGTTFELSLPLTLAIVGALLVRSGQRICALPLTGVVESLRVPREKLATIRGHHALELRGRVVPVTNLDTALGDPGRPIRTGERGYVYLVVVRSGASELALAVDAFVGEQEIVLKSLGTYLGSVNGVAGATVMADGSVALVVRHLGPHQAPDPGPLRGGDTRRPEDCMTTVKMREPRLEERLLAALFSRAMARAGGALAEMAGQVVTVDAPLVGRLTAGEVMDLVGGPGTPIVAVYLGMIGGITGHCLVLLPPDGAHRLAEHPDHRRTGRRPG